MFSQFLLDFKKLDWLLIITVLILVAFGLAAIYSVALGQGQNEFLNFQKQLVWLGVSIIAMLFLANIDYHLWRRWCWVGYLISLVLLILVLTPLGSTVRGTRGWFNLGWLSFQPVELVKIFLVLVLADVYTRYGRTIHKFGQLLVIGLVALIPFVLVVFQPDFGSAMLLFFLWLISFILITKNKWHVLAILGAVILLFAGAWFLLFQDYQKDRVLTFLDPGRDPLGRGYNVRQSVIAVGAGQMFGRGLGFGSQSQLKFIPESQTDFVFAVLAEELGFVGVALVILLFGFVFFRLYRLSARAPDDYGMFLVLLLAILLFIQVFINVGMGVGLLPVTGISLPFISYGGSFLLVIMALLGIVLNVYKSSVVARKT